jgi:hypothetical protein
MQRHTLKNKRVTVYLDADLWFEFRRACLDRHRSASSVLSELLQQFLARRRRTQRAYEQEYKGSAR